MATRLNATVEERLRFISFHWQDAMGWKAIPFWCVVAAEGLYTAKPGWYQVSVLAAGVGLSLVWSRCLQPFVERRIGVMRQPTARIQRGLWRKSLLVIVPLFSIQWLVESLLDNVHRQSPQGWTEHKLPVFLGSYLAIQALHIVDDSNIRSRRIWYAAMTLLCAVQLGALGSPQEPYSIGLALFGGTQCLLAIADLELLVGLAAPIGQIDEVGADRG